MFTFMKLVYKNILLLFFSLVTISCNFFKENSDNEVIARVDETYLYKVDLIKHLPENLSKKDSVLFANQFVNNWATKQLLKQRAFLNLEESKLETFNQLAADYKLDLYSNAYLDVLISKKLDTLITPNELDSLYQKSRQNFKINDELLMYRYVVLEKDYNDIPKVKEKFIRYNNSDKFELDSLSIQFNSFSLNDSIWFKKNNLLNKLPTLKDAKYNQLLKKSNFLQFEDSIRVYLVQIKDVLQRNDQAPQEYVASILEQIILNKRKLKLIKQLEIDIRKDAIQNNEFEIYD